MLRKCLPLRQPERLVQHAQLYLNCIMCRRDCLAGSHCACSSWLNQSSDPCLNAIYPVLLLQQQGFYSHSTAHCAVVLNTPVASLTCVPLHAL